MFLAVDTHYEDTQAVTAGVLFVAATDAASAREVTVRTPAPASYEAGAFYRRELPCVLALWGKLTDRVETVIVDGYVTLNQEGRPGLGAHLYDALGGMAGPSVIGVAKNSFQGSPHAERVLRGTSERPLFVTSAGIPPGDAARLVAKMHGAYRLPTLLRRADQVCRGLIAPKVL